MDIGYATKSNSVEAAPRSPHHAAMLVLEQRVEMLNATLSQLANMLEPAMRPPSPQPAGDEGARNCAAPIIAHVDSVCAEVERCISRTQDVIERLVI